MDTLAQFRRTMEQAGLEEWVVAVVGDSSTVSAHWGAPLSLGLVLEQLARMVSAGV